MMRFLYTFFTLFVCSISFSQINESFSDGDFTANPTWTLNSSSDFTVVTGQLRSANTTTNSNFYISTTNTLATSCQWEFYVNLQFSTSGTNFVDVYLTSDVSNLQSGSINGYYVRIGNTADEISLYRRSGAIGTGTMIIDGVNGSVASSSNNLIKVKVTRDASNLFTLQRDMTGTGTSYVTEGTVTDATFTTSNAFGFYIQQSTASFVQKHFFDDIIVGPIILDVTPPSLVSATALSANTVDVLFNENVDLTTSQIITNYTINGGIGNPSTAARDASNLKLVHLTLSSSLTSGNTYTINVNGVQDIAGNAMTTSTVSFNFIGFSSPVFNDVIVNEMLIDVNPIPAGVPAHQYLELYNKSNKYFNLNGWQISDGQTITTITNNYSLLPNSYVIIAKSSDTSLFTGITNKIGTSSFPIFNITGDPVYLSDNLSTTVDSLRYTTSWYKDAVKDDGGWSLELINPMQGALCSPANNWIATIDPDGGTPGFINSVYAVTPDVTGPMISDIAVIDSLHISVCFNDLITPSQLNTAANYVINGSIGSPTLAVAANGNMCAVVSLATKLTNTTNYTITITGITDCNGNSLSPNTGTFSYYIPKVYDVVINELMPDPPAADDFLPAEEYVELKNTTPYSINLKDWTFSTTSSTKKLPAITIKPDSFIVLTGSGNANAFDNFNIKAYEVTSFPALLNSGTTLALRDSNGTVIHSITYSTSWYNDASKASGGWSLEQIDPNNPCSGQSNWHASLHPSGGTPGRRNSVLASNPDNSSPQLDRITVINADTIVLYFTEQLDSVSLINPTQYTFDNGLVQPTYVLPISPDYKKVKLKLSSSLQVGTTYHCTVSNGVTDCVGNPLNNGTAPFALPQAPAFNDVVINEILTDPKTGGYDFVEIYNRSSKTIDLKDLRIGSMDTLTGILKDTEVITEEGYLLFPEQYLILSENGDAIKQQYLTTNPKGFYDVVNLPSMNNDDDVITLSDQNMLVIDNLKYTSKMHFPLLVSTKGVSLERIDFNRPTNDKTNWNSAAQAVGFATPAYRNSQYLQADGGSGFSISNELFSPDNDGYNDVLNITYKLDDPGKAVNIFIYDSKGRLIKHLTRNEQLATDGTISWNGINDDNEKAAIGIYVVYIELFSFSGKINKYKLACTLAGKL